MAATVGKLYETLINVKPPFKMVDYENEMITAKYIKGLEKQAEDLIKNGNPMAEVKLAFDR